MKRRSFLKAAASTTLLPVTLNGMSIRSHQGGTLLPLIGKRSSKGRVLVIIQLNGGNDGLNTVVPLDQYENLTRARSNVILQDTAVLKLKNQSKTGLHPKMVGAQRLFDQDKMSIVQSVGYPQPDFSHFRSMDIWMSASHSHQVLTSGWVGRYLDNVYPKFPEGYPNDQMKDPLSIQVGPVVSLAFMGPTVNMGMALTNPSTFYDLMDNAVGEVPKNPAGEELAYIRLLAQQTNEYSSVIKQAATKGTNKSTKYPTGVRSGDLSEQLKIVARLIHGGLQTPVYMVSIGGFDTHSEQVTAGDTKEGSHANLLSQLSRAMEAFQDDLQQLGISDRVVTMTFSEFGRRVQSNASSGTDHGAAAPLLVFGDAVQPGIIGNNPSIPSKTTVNDNVPMQFDFRQVYASILQDWFEINPASIKEILGDDYNTLPIFKNNIAKIDAFADYMTQIYLSDVFPNPAKDTSVVRYSTDGGGWLQLRLYHPMGSLVHEYFSKNHAPGAYEYEMNLRGLAPGNYIVQLKSPLKSSTLIVNVQ
jgi:uncharacterized protein (DUF1501 family)